MTLRCFKFVTVLVAGLSIGNTQGVHACSIPDELVLRQSMLNVKYPQATHVLGATWTLQKAGKLDMPDPKRVMARGVERQALESTARLEALRSVAILQAELTTRGENNHAVSLVLVERMHRQRILTAGSRSRDLFSAQDDLVFVTTEPAIRALVQGRLSIEEAVSAGVVRLYGSNRQQEEFVRDFGSVGSDVMTNTPQSALESFPSATHSPKKLPEFSSVPHINSGFQPDS